MVERLSDKEKVVGSIPTLPTMLFTTHVLTGAALGVATQNPGLGLVLGVISHHLGDRIIHFDYGSFYIGTGLKRPPNDKLATRDWVFAVTDVTVGTIVAALLWRVNQYSPAFFFGALGGILPDLMHNVPFWRNTFTKSKLGAKYLAFHHSFHSTAPFSRWWLGTTTNLMLIVLSLLVLL